MIGLAAGLSLSSIVVLAQSIWPDIVLHVTENSGLFMNSDTLGDTAAVVLIGLAFAKDIPVKHRLCLAVMVLPCLIMPSCRGAWLAVAGVAVNAIWSKSRLAGIAVALVLALAAIASYRSGYRLDAIAQRLSMWRDIAPALTWRGHGIGSVWTDFAGLNTTYDTAQLRAEHLHNDWLEAIFEGGIIGAGALAAMLVCLRGKDPTARAILLGIGIEAVTGFPLHLPVTAFLAALCLGHLARERDSLFSALDVGRVRLLAGQNG
jgi:O-antigen ligase